MTATTGVVYGTLQQMGELSRELGVMSGKLGMEYTTRKGLGVQESKGVKSNQWKHQSPKLLYLMLCHGKSGTFSWATSA